MSRRRTLISALAAAVLLALAAAALLLSRIDAEAITHRLEVRLSAAYDLEVKRLGTTELRLWPRPQAVFTDVVVRAGELEVLRAPRVAATVDWLPLLRRRLRVSNLILEAPVLTVRRNADGSFTPGRLPAHKARAEAPPLPVTKATIVGGTIHFIDRVSDSDAVLEGLDWEWGNLRRGADGRLAFAGELHAGRLRVNRVEMRQLRGTFSAQEGIYRAAAMRGSLYGSEAEFDLQADLGGALPAWKLDFSARGLSLAELFRSLSGRALFEGKADVRAALAAKGRGRLVRHLNGTVEVTGSNIIQHGFDLDSFVRSLRESEQIDLVDVGAFLVVGPLGTLLSKSFDLARVYHELHQQQSQHIELAAFHWTVEGGIARAKDVALRTRENRVAVRGAIDLARKRYDGITLAVLDAKGCAELTETITGPLDDPRVETASLLRTLAGPVAGIVEMAREIVTPGDCRPFYRGTVAHPPPR